MENRVRRRLFAGFLGVCLSMAGVSAVAFASGTLTSEGAAASRAGADGTLPPNAVEDFAYPNAAEIRAEKGIALHRGDGRLLLADCDGSADQVQVWTRQTADGKYCFRALADSGYVTLEVPDVYAIQTADHPVSADLTAGGETETVDVAKDGFRGVGEGNGGDPTVLVELRVTG